MNKFTPLALCAATSLLVAGCAGYGSSARTVTYGPEAPRDQVYAERYDGCGDNAALGTVIGAVAGGAIGNQFGSGDGNTAATIGGAILGGIAGNAIARDACDNERADAYYYNTSYADAFDDRNEGRRHDWRNPNNGNYGYVTPRRRVQGDRYGYRNECREFEQTVYINGQRYDDTGIACRSDDGSWRIVSQ